MGATHTEGTTKGTPPLETRAQRARGRTFQEKFRWHTHVRRAIQGDRLLEGKGRRVWKSDEEDVSRR